jgi:hypothetical protein
LDLSPETIDYLTDRAAAYDGDLSDILAITPHQLQCDHDISAFWHDRDLSHIIPQSLRPDLADDWSLIIPEDPSTNRSRGAEVMTQYEINAAHSSNDSLADHLDHSESCSHHANDWSFF